MKKYLMNRLIQLPFVLIGVLICVFLIVQLTPGDPAATVAGPMADVETIERIRHDMGLDQPLWKQFGDYLWGLLHGDFGYSYYRRAEVKEGLFTAFGNTVYLFLFSRIWSILVAIPLGIIAALKKNSWVDRLISVISLGGLSLPQFWLGLISMYLFSLKLKWLPMSGMGNGGYFSVDSMAHLILPAFILGFSQVGSLVKLSRSNMLEVMNQDYIRTARAKGMKEKAIIIRHALKNMALPLVTIIGTQSGYMLGGSIVIENVFTWPGLGKFSIIAIQASDYNSVQASVLLLALLFLLINLIVDLSYGLLDPRVKY